MAVPFFMGIKMKTIKFIKAVSGTNPDNGVTVNYGAGKIIELTNKSAKMYLGAKVAVPAAKKDQEKQHINDQYAEIKRLDDALGVCNEQLRDALDEVKELGSANILAADINMAMAKQIDKFQAKTAKLENSLGEFDALREVESDNVDVQKSMLATIKKIQSENNKLTSEIAEMRNQPVVIGVDLGAVESDKTIIAEIDENGDIINVADASDATDAPVATVAIDAIVATDAINSADVKIDDVPDDDKLSDGVSVDATIVDSDAEPADVVTPAVETKADGTVTKKMPSKATGKKVGK